MSLQCITPTIGLVADQTPDHFVSVSIVSLPSYGCHPSYDHWIIVTTTTTDTTTHNHHPSPPHGGPLFPDCTFTVSHCTPTEPSLCPNVPSLYPPCTLTVSHFTPTEPSLCPNVPSLYSHCILPVPSMYPPSLLIPLYPN